ncbi:MAG: Gfo/Idh/MocA family protein [Promethearchaeota archaeon]
MSNKKAVIVGLGGHARSAWLRALRQHEDWDLIGVVDTDTELLENAPHILKEFGVEEDMGFMKISELIQFGEKPDLAIVATPIPTHHVLVKEAMDAGINVICEKNMASTIYQGRQMVQLALEHPELSTALGFQRRYTVPMWTGRKFFAETADEMVGMLNFIRWYEAFNWGLYREGWRQWLPDLYIEDQAPHWLDLLRYLTGLEIVQARCDMFIPRGSDWQGSGTVIANLALAHPDDYNHRHNWVWCQFYGDWQRRGPRLDEREFSFERGRAKIGGPWGVELLLYTNADGTKWEEDGILPDSDIEKMGVKYQEQAMILEMTKRCIDSGGKQQPGTNFLDTFKSFAATRACVESSRTGKAVFVPKYWEDLPID